MLHGLVNFHESTALYVLVPFVGSVSVYFFSFFVCLTVGVAGSELSSGDEEATRKEEARLKATQRSRDLREKLKRKNQKKDKDGSHSDSGNSGSDNE